MRLLSYFTLATVLAGYSTIVLGGYVSSIGAGLACPDWPTCHGQIVPDLSNRFVAAEYTHRLAAVLAGVFALGAFILVWWFHRSQRKVLLATNLAFGLLVVQIMLGWITVSSLLEPVIVTAHLAVATAFVLLMTVAAILSFGGRMETAASGATPGEEASRVS